jgi:hypothetical protein
MKKNLNIIPMNADLVLIALNPTQEAINNGALFSRDDAFWNLLHRAGIINDVSSVPKKKRQKEVCEEHKHSDIRIGIADMLHDVIETNSREVKPDKGTAENFVRTELAGKKPKRIALLGHKVVDAFAADYNLAKWRDIETINGVKQYGKIGIIIIGGHVIEVFAVPFPINNNIKDKHLIYKKLR